MHLIKKGDIKCIFKFYDRTVTFDLRNSIICSYVIGLKNQKRNFNLKIYFADLGISKLLFDISMISKFLSDYLTLK